MKVVVFRSSSVDLTWALIQKNAGASSLVLPATLCRLIFQCSVLYYTRISVIDLDW